MFASVPATSRARTPPSRGPGIRDRPPSSRRRRSATANPRSVAASIATAGQGRPPAARRLTPPRAAGADPEPGPTGLVGDQLQALPRFVEPGPFELSEPFAALSSIRTEEFWDICNLRVAPSLPGRWRHAQRTSADTSAAEKLPFLPRSPGSRRPLPARPGRQGSGPSRRSPPGLPRPRPVPRRHFGRGRGSRPVAISFTPEPSSELRKELPPLLGRRWRTARGNGSAGGKRWRR